VIDLAYFQFSRKEKDQVLKLLRRGAFKVDLQELDGLNKQIADSRLKMADYRPRSNPLC
jgi:hypothetical protein